jgi:transglutaminase-like putative cysteine protease
MLMIEAVRSLGMAARFVSGYLHVPDHNDDSNAGGGNTHAWVQVYLPGPGWVDFDPASGIVGNRGLVRVAVVRDPRQAIPLHGTWTGFPSDNFGMTVEVNVTARRAGLTGPGQMWNGAEPNGLPLLSSLSGRCRRDENCMQGWSTFGGN